MASKINFFQHLDSPPARAVEPPPAPIEHECCECGADGIFGEDVRLLEGRLGTWYCAGCAPADLKHPSEATP